jgi:hypothetical protein
MQACICLIPGLVRIVEMGGAIVHVVHAPHYIVDLLVCNIAENVSDFELTSEDRTVADGQA